MPGVRDYSNLALLELYPFCGDRIRCRVPLSIRVGSCVIDIHDQPILGMQRSKVTILATLEQSLESPQKVVDHLKTCRVRGRRRHYPCQRKLSCSPLAREISLALLPQSLRTTYSVLEPTIGWLHAGEHSRDAEVFIDVGPVNACRSEDYV